MVRFDFFADREYNGEFYVAEIGNVVFANSMLQLPASVIKMPLRVHTGDRLKLVIESPSGGEKS